MGDHDRDAILARRALFISTTLAGIACSSHDTYEQPGPKPDQTVAHAEVESQPVKPIEGTRPSWSEIMAAAPPLDVPQGLTENEKRLLSDLASSLLERYAVLEKVWTTLPGCAPSQADCEAWAGSVRAIATAEDDEVALCGYLPETTHTYVERQLEHLAYLEKVGDLLLADLDAAAKAYTAEIDQRAWSTQRRARMAQPRPCLDCMAPTALPVLEYILFYGDGEAVLTETKDDILQRRQLREVAEIHEKNGTTRLIVRGHADPSEPDPDQLAKRRAEYIAAELIQLGVPKADLDVRSYGATLLVTRDPEQALSNRRVDFEVVQR